MFKFSYEDSPTKYQCVFDIRKDTMEIIIRKCLASNKQLTHENYYLFNTSTMQYIYNEKQIQLTDKNMVLQMKDCTKHAKDIVITLDKIIVQIQTNTQTNDIKKFCYDLSQYVLVSIFAEEFIAYQGLPKLILLIELTTGNTKTYFLNSFNELINLQSSIDYVRENMDVFNQFYKALMSESNNPNYIPTLFSIFKQMIVQYADEGVDYFMKAAEEYSRQNGTLIYSEVVEFLNSRVNTVKEDVIYIILSILKKVDDKNQRTRLYIKFKEANLVECLEKNSKCQSIIFQQRLTQLQHITNDVIKGSEYETENYRQRIESLEDEIRELECQLDLRNRGKRFYQEIVDDFIYLKKIAEKSTDFSLPFDYYTPQQRYDKNLSELAKKKEAKENVESEEVKNLKNLNKVLHDSYDELQYEYQQLLQTKDCSSTTSKSKYKERYSIIPHNNLTIPFNLDSSNDNLMKTISVDNPIVPSLSIFSEVPGVFPVPEIPGIPPVPGIPSIPGIPPVPGIPGVPPVPGIPGVPPIPGIPGVPGLPLVVVPQIQPTKPKIILTEKVKGLAWKRLIQETTTKNFWSNVREIKIPQDEVVPFFAVKTTMKTIKKPQTTKPAIQYRRFLDDKRTQSVGITIAKLPSVIKVEEALKSMNNEILTDFQIDNMVTNFITDEEIAKAKANTEPFQWAKGEAYLLGLHSIAFCKEKLSIWLFINNYPSEKGIIEKSITFLDLACDEIKNSELLRILFSYILTVGNIINGGTDKGQADGFNLEILPKLTTTKDNTGRTFLQMVCSMMKLTNKDFADFAKMFPNVQESTSINFIDVKGNYSETNKKLTQTIKHLTKITEEVDAFKSRAEKLIGKAGIEMEEIENKLTKLEAKFKDLVTSFGIDEKDPKLNKTSDFFRLMYNFFLDVDKSIPKTEPKKAFNRKHAAGKKVAIAENTTEEQMKMNEVLNKLKSSVRKSN